MLERIRRHLGYRGTALLFLGVVWFAVGSRILQGDTDPAHKLPIEYLPVEVRAGIWWVAAAVAVMAAVWPSEKTRMGYAALVIPAALRAASYAGAFGMWVIGEVVNSVTDVH